MAARRRQLDPERSTDPRDYYFDVYPDDYGDTTIALTARVYFDREGYQSDWELHGLLSHVLGPLGINEEMESTFSSDRSIDEVTAQLLTVGFVQGPPAFQELFAYDGDPEDDLIEDFLGQMTEIMTDQAVPTPEGIPQMVKKPRKKSKPEPRSIWDRLDEDDLV